MGRIVQAIAALIAFSWVAAPSAALAGVSVSIIVAPPILPIYVQPEPPGPDYIWIPGYWAYEDDDYYWVPGTWVIAPQVGYLWTPGYWYWREGVYVWSAGYWGPRVGYYGGINYGCGYTGSGYWGGRWEHGAFYYNTAVTHVNVAVIHNTYINKTIINTTTAERVSFNGGNGGTKTQPTAQELEIAHEHHVGPTELQTKHEHAASTNHALFASVNHGAPPVAATAKPAQFKGHGVIPSKHAAASHEKVLVGPKTTKGTAVNSSTRALSGSANTASTAAPKTIVTSRKPFAAKSGPHKADARLITGAGASKPKFVTHHAPPGQHSMPHGHPNRPGKKPQDG